MFGVNGFTLNVNLSQIAYYLLLFVCSKWAGMNHLLTSASWIWWVQNIHFEPHLYRLEQYLCKYRIAFFKQYPFNMKCNYFHQSRNSIFDLNNYFVCFRGKVWAFWYSRLFSLFFFSFFFNFSWCCYPGINTVSEHLFFCCEDQTCGILLTGCSLRPLCC